MLKNIYVKSLFERRIGVLCWSIGIFLLIFGVGLMFPSMRDLFGKDMAQIPKEFQGWFGETTNIMTTFSGYMATELVGNIGIMLVIMAILYGITFIAGDEEKNVLQSLLTLPVSRTQVYFQKYFALTTINILAIIVWAIAVLVVALTLNEPLKFSVLFKIIVMFFLTNMTLSTFAYSLSAISGKRSVGGIVTGCYAFLAYFVNALSAQSDIVAKINYLSIFKYADYISLINRAIDLNNVLLMLSLILLFMISGLLIFTRRDIQLN